MSGGSEELWTQAAIWLSHRGHDVHASVPAMTPDSPRFSALRSAGVKVTGRLFPTPSIAKKIARTILRRKGTEVDSAVAWIGKLRPNLVVISQPGYIEGVSWSRLLLADKVPYVSVVHSLHRMTWLHDDYIPIVLEAYTGAKCVFLVAEAIREMLEDQLGVTLTNTSIFRNPYNVPYHPSVTWPSHEGGWRLAMVGRLEPASKAQDLVLRVLAKQKWKQRALSVSIFGSGPQERILRALAARLECDNVQFRGPTDDVEAIWNSHHALLQPSRYEGVPLTLIEAMLCARPAIASAVGGIPEILEDAVNGFLVPAATEILLDESIEKAWARKDGWEEMGQNARRTVVRSVPEEPVRAFCDALLLLASRN